MCLITKQSKPKIATKDKVIYKILDPYCCSIYYSFEYQMGILYKTKILETEDDTTFDDYDSCMLEEKYGRGWKYKNKIKSIGSGFHGALTKERLEKTLENEDGHAMENDGTIWKCIIPAGSEYYTNPSGLIVSNQIIIKEKCK